MARKKRNKTSQPMPPKAAETVWEIGRQPLAVTIGDLDPEAGQPELLLVVEAAEPSLVVFGGPVMSSDPPDRFVQLVQQAMHEPLIGEPRRPACIRVRSQSEADILRVMVDTAGIELEVVPELAALDAAHAELTQALGGIEGDYRTRAEQAGEALSEEGLRVVDGCDAANSVVTVLPSTTAPAARSAVTAAQSRLPCQPTNRGEPCSVAMSAVSMMSLIPTGIPSMGDKIDPDCQRFVDASAAARAASMFKVTKAPTPPSCASMTSRQRSKKARGESLPSLKAPVCET